MVIYQLEFTDAADSDFSRLENHVAQRVLDRLRWMADNAEAIRHIPLTGRYRNMFRLRIGDYRAIYTLDQTGRKITVHSVKHRSVVYRSG